MDHAALVSLVVSGVLAVALSAGGFIVKNLYANVRTLDERGAALDRALAEQTQRTAEIYLRREDCHRQNDAVLTRLAGIENKLDRVIERMGGGYDR